MSQANSTRPKSAISADHLRALEAKAERLEALVDRLAGQVAPIVRASRFELVDAKGRVRAVLGEVDEPSPSGGSPGLALYDSTGARRAVFCLDDHGESGIRGDLFFTGGDAAGYEIVAHVGVDPEGRPFLTLCGDETGVISVERLALGEEWAAGELEQLRTTIAAMGTAARSVQEPTPRDPPRD